MINSRGGGSNNVNPNQMQNTQPHHHQRQNMNHFQGQPLQQRHQSNPQHSSHNHQNSAQSINRNPASSAPGQNRPHRPHNQTGQPQSNSHSSQQAHNHHHQNNVSSGQQIRSSSGQNNMHGGSGASGQPNQNNARSHSGMNNQNAPKQNNQANNVSSTQSAANNGPPLPAVLPKGWKREEIIRTKGLSAGLVDVVYVPQPNSELSNIDIVGKKFRNKIELRKHFGVKYDTMLLDFKTGKVSQSAWRRQRRMKSIAANISNYASAAKYDTYLNLPVRQNTSVLKHGVFNVTNNHKNDPAPASVIQTTGPNGQPINRSNEKPKPTQLFWELRFNNLKAIDSKIADLENIDDEYELENISKFKNFSTSNETVLRSVAASWYLNQNKILIGQEKEFTKNARIFIDREQPLIPQTSVKEDDIKLQENKVKEMRKKLQSALDDLENIEMIDVTDFEVDADEVEDTVDEINDQVEQIDETEIKNVPVINQ